MITFCCSVVLRLPDCCAFARRRCTASSTSFCWARKASPSFCVHSSLSCHRLQHLGKGDQRLHADVPGLVLDRLDRCVALDVRIGLHPARGVDHLERIGGGHQHLGEHRIRVQGDRRDERLDLFGLEGGGRRRRGGCLRRWRRCGQGRGRRRRRGRGRGLGRRVGLRRRRCRNLNAAAHDAQGSGDERRSCVQRKPLEARLHAHPSPSDRRAGSVHLRQAGKTLVALRKPSPLPSTACSPAARSGRKRFCTGTRDYAQHLPRCLGGEMDFRCTQSSVTRAAENRTTRSTDGDVCPC